MGVEDSDGGIKQRITEWWEYNIDQHRIWTNPELATTHVLERAGRSWSARTAVTAKI